MTPNPRKISISHLGNDPRISFICQDGEAFLHSVQDQQFDLVFADSWPGKFNGLQLALNIVARGGYYIIDDLYPQPGWPEGHAPKVPLLVNDLEGQQDFVSLKLDWASGLMVLVRVS